MKRVVTGDPQIQQLQDNVSQAFQSASPMAGGRVLGTPGKPIALASGSNTIPHGLKGQPRFWVLLDNTASATVYRTKWDKTNLFLTASSATTVLIWVN